jgi:hypothetical protein
MFLKKLARLHNISQNTNIIKYNIPINTKPSFSYLILYINSTERRKSFLFITETLEVEKQLRTYNHGFAFK